MQGQRVCHLPGRRVAALVWAHHPVSAVTSQGDGAGVSSDAPSCVTLEEQEETLLGPSVSIQGRCFTSCDCGMMGIQVWRPCLLASPPAVLVRLAGPHVVGLWGDLGVCSPPL